MEPINFCPECGEKREGDLGFCGSCGHNFNAVSASAAPGQPPPLPAAQAPVPQVLPHPPTARAVPPSPPLARNPAPQPQAPAPGTHPPLAATALLLFGASLLQTFLMAYGLNIRYLGALGCIFALPSLASANILPLICVFLSRKRDAGKGDLSMVIAILAGLHAVGGIAGIFVIVAERYVSLSSGTIFSLLVACALTAVLAVRLIILARK